MSHFLTYLRAELQSAPDRREMLEATAGAIALCFAITAVALLLLVLFDPIV